MLLTVGQRKNGYFLHKLPIQDELYEHCVKILQAFTMIDQNRDGLIDVSDLKEMYSNLGKFL